MDTADTTPNTPDAAAQSVAQRGLASKLVHTRTMLAVCEYFQRHSPVDETTMADLLAYLIDAYRQEISEVARLARLYSLVPADLELNRSQFDDGRTCRSTRARLEYLRAQVRADLVWYGRELQRNHPADVADLWTALLAATQEHSTHIEALFNV